MTSLLPVDDATPSGRLGQGPWAHGFTLAALVVLGAFLAADLVADAAEGVGPAHLAVEAAVLCVALLGAAGAATRLRRALRGARALGGAREGDATPRSDADALVCGVGEAIEVHLTRRALTLAERGLALLVLKGLSHQEIAAALGTTERDVRRKALALYRKAGVASRAELAASFLEDVLAHAAPPDGSRGRRARPPVTPPPA